MYAVRGSSFAIRWSEIISQTVDIYYKAIDAAAYTAIGTGLSYTAGSEFGQGEYNWSVPTDLATGSYMLKVCDHDYPDEAYFEQQFYIVDSEKNNGALWTLQWSEIISNTVDIHYRINSGLWVLIQAGVENHTGAEFGQGSYDWNIDTGACDSLEVRISDTENEMYAYSPAVAIVISTTNNISVAAQLGQPTSTGSISVFVEIAGSAQIAQPQSSAQIAVVIAVNGTAQIGQPTSVAVITLGESPAANNISVNAQIAQPTSTGSIQVIVSVSGTAQIRQPNSNGYISKVNVVPGPTVILPYYEKRVLTRDSRGFFIKPPQDSFWIKIDWRHVLAISVGTITTSTWQSKGSCIIEDEAIEGLFTAVKIGGGTLYERCKIYNTIHIASIAETHTRSFTINVRNAPER